MTPALLVDLALAPLTGWAGTKAMEPVSTWMYDHESPADREREDAARSGPPYRIAAQKTAALLGVELTEAQLDKAALGFHYGLAISWAPTYALLRRRTDLKPVAATLLSGAAMSAIVDEGLTPALGFSARTAATPPPPTCAGSSRTSPSVSASPPLPRPPGRCCAAARSDGPPRTPCRGCRYRSPWTARCARAWASR